MEDGTSHRPKPVTVWILCKNDRFSAIRTTRAHALVARLASGYTRTIDFGKLLAILDLDVANCEVVIVAVKPEDAELARQFIPAELESPSEPLSALPLHLQKALLKYIDADKALWLEQLMVKEARSLSPILQRALERLGYEGFEILQGQNILAQSKSTCDVANASLLAYKHWTAPPRRAYSKLLIAWNVVIQAYLALEMLAALLAAMETAGKVGEVTFGCAFLQFGRREPGIVAKSVSETFERYLGKNGGNHLAVALSIPIQESDVERCGLAGCGVPDFELVRAGRHTMRIVLTQLRRLARLVVLHDPLESGRGTITRKSSNKRAYDALHHGFPIVFPSLAPMKSIHGVEVRTFYNDADFEELIRKASGVAEIIDLDDEGDVVYHTPPLDVSSVKAFVKVVRYCNHVVGDFTQFELYRAGSKTGMFPYLVDYSRILSPEYSALVTKRLDELIGRGPR